MRTTPALVLAAASAMAALGCGTAKTSAPTPAPAPAGPSRSAPQQRQLPNNPSDSGEAPAGAFGGRGRGGAATGAQAGPASPQPYNRVVTARAQTKNGLFKVHQIGDRVLFEIPRRQLDKDILLVQEIAQTTLGAGYGGQAAGNRVLRFERRENRIVLRGISYEIMASDTTSPVAGAVQASNVHPIIATFNVEAYGPDSAAVIDVTRLFTQPPPELSPGQRIGTGYTVDPTRSWIERVASFPDNVNVYSTLTFAQGNAGRGAAPAGPGRGGYQLGLLLRANLAWFGHTILQIAGAILLPRV